MSVGSIARCMLPGGVGEEGLSGVGEGVEGVATGIGTATVAVGIAGVCVVVVAGGGGGGAWLAERCAPMTKFERGILLISRLRNM